jgi:hypothetical protein
MDVRTVYMGWILKVDTSCLQVKVPKEAFCEVNSHFKIGLPPDAVWNILIDPGNKRVFKNIQVNLILLLYLSQIGLA